MVTLGIVTTESGPLVLRTLADYQAFTLRAFCRAHVALHFMHYNFMKIHSTLLTTPAQTAGVTDRLWEIEDLVALLG